MSIAAVTELLRARLGIDPASLGAGTIEQAIAGRMRALGSDDLSAYATRIGADAEQFQALAEKISVPETWFFRGGIDLFTHLAAVIRQPLSNLVRGSPFRVLSAPCSSGEEAYSLGLALAEAGVPSSACAIEGIDISRTALEKARRGRFRDFSFRQTDPELRERYFRYEESGWEIAPGLRDSVRFRQGNLVESAILAGEQPYDLIFCRNLLIYLHRAARVRVLDNLLRSLAPNGLLCTGHAEPIQLQDPRFELVPPERFMLYRLASKPTQPGYSEQLGWSKPRPRASLAAPAPVATAEPRISRALAVPVKPDELVPVREMADAGRIDAALAACIACLERVGPSAGAYALLGILRQARHEKDEAIRCFEKALYLQPDHDEALTHLMLLCKQLGQADRAAILRRRLERARSGDRT
jgi:chemotaxis protein methyltransferase WspC